MKLILGCLMLCMAGTSYADCSLNYAGQLVEDNGAPCVRSNNTYGSNSNDNRYRRDGDNLYGTSVNNYRDTYNTYDNGRTWNSTSPSSSSRRNNNSGLGVNTDVYAPNPYLNQNNNQQQQRNNGITWNPIRP